MRLKLSITLLTGFLEFGQAITGVASDPFISEIVAANDKTLKDNFGEASDYRAAQSRQRTGKPAGMGPE